MNLSKAWNSKLEVGIFWPSKNPYKQCGKVENYLLYGSKRLVFPLYCRTGVRRKNVDDFDLDVPD